MEGIVVIIVIISLLSRFVNGMKTVKQNAPGQTAAPVKPAAPAPVAPVRREAAKPTQPSVRPTVNVPAPTAQGGGFWAQMMEALEELEEDVGEKQASTEPMYGSLPKPKAASSDSGHTAVGSLSEGSSRECERGSLGGSMAYTHSDGAPTVQRRAAAKSEMQETPVYRPAMDAEEMRKAVVMAEILKRPQDRMAEQARRWTLR